MGVTRSMAGAAPTMGEESGEGAIGVVGVSTKSSATAPTSLARLPVSTAREEIEAARESRSAGARIEMDAGSFVTGVVAPEAVGEGDAGRLSVATLVVAPCDALLTVISGTFALPPSDANLCPPASPSTGALTPPSENDPVGFSAASPSMWNFCLCSLTFPTAPVLTGGDAGAGRGVSPGRFSRAIRSAKVSCDMVKERGTSVIPKVQVVLWTELIRRDRELAAETIRNAQTTTE